MSRALLEAMREAGREVTCSRTWAATTPGSSRPTRRRAATARTGALPELVLCPHEFVALSAAQGYAPGQRGAQAVLVHVDCGTRTSAVAVHNATSGRVPVLILVSLSPVTAGGRAPGGRNEFIHWLQDTADQAGIVRGYVRSTTHEIRTGRNAQTARPPRLADRARAT